MFFLLARDNDGSLRLLSPATFETRRDALDELARVARSSTSFSEPDEVFVGDIDAVSPVLLVRVGEMHVEQPVADLPPVADTYPVEPAYAEAVVADIESEADIAEEPAETAEETLIEAAVLAPPVETEMAPAEEPPAEPASAEEAEPEVPLMAEETGPETGSTAWPWMAGLPETAEAAEAADHEPSDVPTAEAAVGEAEPLSWIVPLESEVQPATPEPVPLEAEPAVEAYEPPAYEEPSVDAVAFVPPAEDVYVPRPVIMGDYAESPVSSGWDDIREPKGVTEAEGDAADPFAAVEAPTTADEDLPGMPDFIDAEEAVEEPVIETGPDEAAADETPAVTDPEQTPDLALPMWRPDTPPVPPAETPVAETVVPESTESQPEDETAEVAAATEPDSDAATTEPSQPAGYVEVPEEASAAFPGLEAFLASRGITPDIRSVPSGMPQAEDTPGAALSPSADDAVGYEPGGSDLSASTCDDCVYVNTCPKAHQSTPADCGSFQWKAV